MLENVRFFNFDFKKIFFISIIILFSYKVSAKEKEQIIQEMYNLKTLEFTFDQLINDKREKGNCILEFPGKLKCEYFDNKQKELVINNKRLAISQKRYNKTYYYPISNSPFKYII